MPIFQDPERQRFYDLWSDDHHRHHHHHHKDQGRQEESRNPAPSWDVFGHADYGCGVSNSDVTSLGDDLRTPGPHFSKLQPSDRGELIQCLKNDASTWVQNQLVWLILNIYTLFLLTVIVARFKCQPYFKPELYVIRLSTDG